MRFRKTCFAEAEHGPWQFMIQVGMRLAEPRKRKPTEFYPTMPNRIEYLGLLKFRQCFAALLFLIAVSNESRAAFGFKLDGTLDKEAISNAYFEGDFARVLPPLEMYRQSFPASATREDSIFVFKYLSVIYAADPYTRAKAESYMVQLLRVMPTIELIDLYISDNIQAIFNNVKQNLLKQQQYTREFDVYGRPIDDNATVQPRPRPGKPYKWVGWTLGGVGAAAVAAGIFYAFNNGSKPNPDRISVSTGKGQ